MDLDKHIQGCCNNSRKSQEIIYKQLFPKMHGMCMRYVDDRSLAAGIVNDGFLKVFTKIDSYSNRGSFEGWVRRIVFHCLSDYIRKNEKHIKVLEFGDIRTNVTNERILAPMYVKDILKLLDSVGESSAEVFVMYSIHGYSHKDIAELKGISVGTSKWHLSNAKEKMRKLLTNSSNPIIDAG